MTTDYQSLLEKSEDYEAPLFGGWGKNNLQFTFLQPSLIPNYYTAALSPTVPANDNHIIQRRAA